MTRTCAEVSDLFEDRNLFPVYQMPGEPQEYIPYDLIAPHERQALQNHAQTLHRLAERGGLDWGEILAVITDRDWGTCHADRDKMRSAVRQYIAEKGNEKCTEQS